VIKTHWVHFLHIWDPSSNSITSINRKAHYIRNMLSIIFNFRCPSLSTPPSILLFVVSAGCCPVWMAYCPQEIQRIVPHRCNHLNPLCPFNMCIIITAFPTDAATCKPNQRIGKHIQSITLFPFGNYFRFKVWFSVPKIVAIFSSSSKIVSILISCILIQCTYLHTSCIY